MPQLNAIGIVSADLAHWIRSDRRRGATAADRTRSSCAYAGFAGVRAHREPESEAERSGTSGDELPL